MDYRLEVHVFKTGVVELSVSSKSFSPVHGSGWFPEPEQQEKSPEWFQVQEPHSLLQLPAPWEEMPGKPRIRRVTETLIQHHPKIMSWLRFTAF
jgi:hypothetical protein